MEIERTSGIYAIRNKRNNKYYIGSSENVNARIQAHLYNLRKGNSFKKLQKDFDKFGEESIEFFVLENVVNVDELKEREEYYINEYNSIEDGYNTRFAIPLGRNDVTTVLNNNVYRLMVESCKEKGVSKSSWVREAVLEKLDRERKIK